MDAAVAVTVNGSQEAFYKTNPWLRPPTPPSDWDKFGGGVADDAKNCWGGVVDFYEEHKKIIDTILIVAGAVLAIDAVICTGGMALAPLLAGGLTALGVLAATAATVATVTSLVVAGIAVTSTLASSTLNIIDTWGEIDNPAFNTWQSVLNWTSGISNGLYSVGSIYNSVRGITNQSIEQGIAVANKEILLKRLQIYIQSEDYTSAENYAIQLKMLAPSEFRSYQIYFQKLAAMGKYNKVEELLAEAEKYADIDSDIRNKADICFDKATMMI